MNLQNNLNKKQRGFTIIELMVAISVLTIISLFGANIYLSYTQSARNLKANNLIYEEGRFLMEKIVKEIRRGGIDYEEYFNQSNDGLPGLTSPLLEVGVLPANLGELGELGHNYCQYDRAFYTAGNDGLMPSDDDESQGTLNPGYLPAINTPLQENLYLINNAGDERTYFTRVERDVSGNTIGKIGMLKLIGRDFGTDGIDSLDSYNGEQPTDTDCRPDDRENDGLIDTWHCHPDFNCYREVDINGTDFPICDGYAHVAINDVSHVGHSFEDISPNAINILDLNFVISPSEDPWKAYENNGVQNQPYITIQMTIEANPAVVSGLQDGRVPQITLNSTISTRNYGEIKSSCI